jgi:hypothetical protein
LIALDETNNKVFEWTIANGQLVSEKKLYDISHCFHVRDLPVFLKSFASSPDGQTMAAVAADDGNSGENSCLYVSPPISSRHLSDQKWEKHKLPKTLGKVDKVFISQDGFLLACLAQEWKLLKVCLFRLNKHNEICDQTDTKHIELGHYVWSFDFTPDLSILALINTNNDIVFVDTNTWKRLGNLALGDSDSSGNKFCHLRFAPDARFLFCKTFYSGIKIFSRKEWTKDLVLPHHQSYPWMPVTEHAIKITKQAKEEEVTKQAKHKSEFDKNKKSAKKTSKLKSVMQWSLRWRGHK